MQLLHSDFINFLAHYVPSLTAVHHFLITKNSEQSKVHFIKKQLSWCHEHMVAQLGILIE